MKIFFVVEQADKSECYSGRFKVSNCYLDVSNEAYKLQTAIDDFTKTFKKEYNYWHNIYDKDLNKEALGTKKRFKEFSEAYERVGV